MHFGFAAAALSIAAAGLGAAAALRAFLLAVLSASSGSAYYGFAQGYAVASFAVLTGVAVLLTIAMMRLSRQERSARTLLIVALVAGIAVTVADLVVWPRLPGMLSYFNPVTADGFRWAWLAVLVLTVVLVVLPVTAPWFEDRDSVPSRPRGRVAVGFAVVAAAAGCFQLWLFGSRLVRGWTLLSLLSPPELIGAEVGSVVVLEAVVAALIAGVLLVVGAALFSRGRRSGVVMLQLGGLISFAQAVFLSVDVIELFTDMGFTAVTDILM